MTSYVVSWGRGNQRTISGPDELDSVLDEVAAADHPNVVGIYPPEHFAEEFSPWDDGPQLPALQVGLGHPDRAFLLFIGEGGGLGYQQDMPAWPAGAADLAFDYGGDPVLCGQDRARVSPETARRAAREFVTTGRRPTSVEWVDA